MRLAYSRAALLLSSATSSHAFLPRSIARQRSSRLFMSTSSSTNNDSLRLALLQFPVTDDKTVNQATAEAYIRRAVEQQVQLVVLPEIWNSPYATAAFPAYAEDLPDVGDTSAATSPSSDLLRRLAVEHGLWIVGGSIPEQANGRIYNTSLVFDPTGTVVAKHRKVHLFDIDVPGGIRFKESDTLSAGSTVSTFTTEWGDIGLGICYDIRFAEYALLLRQCRLLVYPGAFNMTTGPAHWELLQRARALDNQCFVATASPARTEAPLTPGPYPHYTAWGHSTVVDPWGTVVATRDETPGMVVADLDLSKVNQVRESIPILQQRRTDLYSLSTSK